MTTEKQTPEQLAELRADLQLIFTDEDTSLSPGAQMVLSGALRFLDRLASAQAQQEPPAAHGVFVGTRLVKLEESAQLAGEWAQREIVRGSPLTYHIRSLYTAPPVQQAEPLALNGIKATMFHDEGAIAQCGYCRRYSLDPKTLGDRQPACECGEKHGWSGSFKKPGADAQWSGARPACAPQPERAGVVPGGLLNEEEMADLRRFDETVRDEGSYDIPKERMRRLAEIGVIRRTTGSQYCHTYFGLSLLNAAPPAPAVETVPVPVADLMKLKALTNFNTSALAAAVSAMASEWLTAPPAPAVEKTRPGFIPQDASIQVTHWPELPAVEKREPLTLHQISDAAREAQIAFCLDKYTSFEVALARAIERAHGITPADAKEGE